MRHTFFIKHFCGQTFNICSTSHSSSPKGWGRGWDVLCSRCLWLPSNRKPIEVDILNCQNGLPAEMELISSYLRRKRNQPCAQPCPRAAESDPFPEPSHATVKILEATKEQWNWFFHRRERLISMNFQLQLPPWPAGLALKRCFGLLSIHLGSFWSRWMKPKVRSGLA